MKLFFRKEYLLIFLLLFFSGNPLSSFLFGKFSAIVGILFTILILNKKLTIPKKFLKPYFYILIGITSITIAQLITLPYVSIVANINLLFKFLLGGYIVYRLKEHFPYYFFKVLGFLSIASLVFFIIINLFAVPLPYLDLGEVHNSYLIYNTSFESHMHRNGGMFWEPGAFAGILTICLALNLNNLKTYWRKHKVLLLSILLALITTQSTTGYLVGFLILVFVFLKPNHFGVSLIAIPTLIIVGSFIYETTDFLKNKIEDHFYKATILEVGEFSNTRFGVILFDWHYIKKHPLVGNGFDEKVRYADHQHLFVGETGDVVGSGNSVSHYWACMGIFFIIGYFLLLWRATIKKGKLYAFLILLVVFLNLQGEQWFNFPLYLGILFLTTKEYKRNNEVNLQTPTKLIHV